LQTRFKDMPRVTITVPEKTPQPYRFQLDRQSVTLGRGSENDIPIDCGSVSVKHAEMRRVKGGYELHDLGSTNGIKLDGERREMITLRNGLGVKLGDVTFDFSLTDEELEALAIEKPENESPVDRMYDDAPMELPPLKDEAGQPSESSSGDTEEDRPSSGGGCVIAIVFLILAAAAFLAGLAVRHQQDTGESLIDALKEKFSVTAPAKPAAPQE
jgi:pSer/pThr/pTyr-binding forkhead associated (FHA) protein